MQEMKSPVPLAGGRPGRIRNESASQSIADHRPTAARLPPATNFCQCAACDRYFGGVTGFDLHRSSGKCADPATLGMAIDTSGVWRRSAPDMGAVHDGVEQTADFAINPVRG